MATLYITHEAFLEHDTGEWHPERAERIKAIDNVLSGETFQNLHRVEAPLAGREHIVRAHPESYFEFLERTQPKIEIVPLDDGDTLMSPGTWNAALRSVGAGIQAVDEVMQGLATNAFCLIRPPGHHAEPDKAHGFCLFNNVAIAAFHAQAVYGAERVAVVDFDVHHGNGTQTMFWSKPGCFYASTHQMPLFPGTGSIAERGETGIIVNMPLRAGDGSFEFRDAYESVILPALRSHRPDLIVVSAGFDAHRADPLANLNLIDDDFGWITRKLTDVARECCNGRIVSMLEGGYDLAALSRSVGVHVQGLLEAS